MHPLWLTLPVLLCAGTAAGAPNPDSSFTHTEGLDLIWELQQDPANLVFSSPTAQLQGMAYYDAEYRWPAVRGSNGSITVTVPRAGRFHPAVVVYDTAGAEGYEVRIDGVPVGRFTAAEDDRRQRVYFSPQAIAFKGGEKLSVHTDGTGAHITEDILLLARPPKIRARRFEITHLEAAYTDRDGPPRARVTWITTWPVACTVECGGITLTEAKPVANHRVFLEGLPFGKRYRPKVTALRPDGTPVVAEGPSFVLAAPVPRAGSVRTGRVPLKVENPYPFALSRFPVTSGVPFARGELGDPAATRLLDSAGREVLVQTKVTGRWADGSIKWLLVSFLADAPPRQTAAYALEYGTRVKRAAGRSPLSFRWTGDVLTVENGALRVRFDAAQSGFPTRIWEGARGEDPPDGESLCGELHMGAQITDTRGERFTTNNPPERMELEEAGPVRLVVKTSGHHLSEGNTPFFAYENRFIFYAGLPIVHVQYTWGNDWAGSEFATFKEISFRLPLPAAPAWQWWVGLGDGELAEGRGALSLAQWRDDSFTLTPSPSQQTTLRRADGCVSLARDDRPLTLAVRHFWQLYPKGIRLDAEGLALDVAPNFPAGTYDGCTKLDEVKLYYYLMGGQYKVRRGVRKQHEWALLLQPPAEARPWAQAFQEPLIAACPPQRYGDTGVFGEIL
ncbi:MAG: hypothetical protein QHJ73_11270, partial [Armatimonadota bacterium]|nr:hypothetical protein [Armatimonadota bacterium]